MLPSSPCTGAGWAAGLGTGSQQGLAPLPLPPGARRDQKTSSQELPPAPCSMNQRAGYPQLLPQPPLPQKNPSPAKQTPQPYQKAWQGPNSPNSQARMSIPPQPQTHPGERGAQVLLLHVHLHLSNGRVLVLQGDRAGSPRPPRAVPSPSLPPPPCSTPPTALSQGCRCAGWELLGSGVGQGQ